MESLLQFLNRLGLARVAAMAVVAVLMLGLFGFLVLRASSPQMAPLYTDLTLEDSSAIVAELRSAGVPYEVRGDGDTILVPRDQITSTRMTLAGSGLPTRGQVGYEIFDRQNALGTTSFVQNINNVRALEGELARTIASMVRIRTARVHLVLPERELFRRERQAPSAAIALSVRGELTAGEIRAIQHLVASSIEGMTPMRVSIVDDNGRLLASGGGDGNEGALAGSAQERALALETRLRQRVEDMLDNVLGAGKARVQVTAELDLNRLQRTSETFDPEGQVVRSNQTRETSSATSGARPSGEVSVSGELPGGSAQSSATTGERNATTDETINYEISRVTETATVEPGSVRRLSVAVVVDGLYLTDGRGGSAYQPRSADEIAQLIALVRSAVGFDGARGDQIEVVNLQFAARPELGGAGTGAGDTLFDFTRDDLMQAAELVVTLLIALALVVFVMRPLLRRVLTPETPLALLQSAALPGTGERPTGQLMVVPQHQASGAADPGSGVPAWVSNARSLGEVQAQTVRSVGSLVSENPKQAALIVRDWLGNAA